MSLSVDGWPSFSIENAAYLAFVMEITVFMNYALIWMIGVF